MSESVYNIVFPFIGTVSLTTSNIIDILGIIASLFTSIVAIAISVKTLRQNSEMIEESSRPYVTLYASCIHGASSGYYLILKNFGQSSARIDSFTYDFDLNECSMCQRAGEPFQDIEGTNIVPGQAFRTVIDRKKILDQTHTINFHICYSSSCKKYEEDICLNLLAHSGNLELFNETKGKELRNISDSLQQLNINNL